MPAIPDQSIVATKNADGSTTFQLYSGRYPQQFLVTQWNMPSADTTSLNTNVFAGATNATRTFNYTEADSAAQQGIPVVQPPF